MEGLENQKEYVIGQFYGCYTPSSTHWQIRFGIRSVRFSPVKLANLPICFIFKINQLGTGYYIVVYGISMIVLCFVASWTPADTLALPEIPSVLV